MDLDKKNCEEVYISKIIYRYDNKGLHILSQVTEKVDQSKCPLYY